MPDIKASIGVKDGKPCYNIPEDQKTIMNLLEKIDSSNGGVKDDPKWRRPADGALRWGACPHPLFAAILYFQTKNAAKLPFRPDGHVDPGGPMIRLMNSLAATITASDVIVTGDPVETVTLELHDWRIPGGPGIGPNYIAANIYPRHSMDVVLGVVDRVLSGNRRIGRLLIMAHGIHAADDDLSALVGVLLGHDLIQGGYTTYTDHDIGDAQYGSNVLAAGRHAENLSLWRRFRGRIDEIRFLSCGAASLSRGTSGIADPDRSGYEMCKQFALDSGAYVMAAEQTQNFSYGYRPYGGLASQPKYREDWNYVDSVPTDFGAWEGPVYVFSPVSGRMIASSTNGKDPVYTRGA